MSYSSNPSVTTALKLDAKVRVEFGSGGGVSGILFNATVKDIDIKANIVCVHIAEDDPKAKQYFLHGQDMYVEPHRVHPPEEKHSFPIKRETSHLRVPPPTPRMSSSRLTFSNELVSTPSASYADFSDDDDEGREESLMSWNSVSTSIYSSIANGLGIGDDTAGNKAATASRGRRNSLSESISQFVPDMMHALSHTFGMDDDDEEDDVLSSDDEEEGVEMSPAPPMNSLYVSRRSEADMARKKESKRFGHSVGDHVVVLLGGSWRDGVVIGRSGDGGNYTVRLDHPPKFCHPERQFWASHVRKALE